MHIAIIGNGISGITTARHLRKQSDHEITVISAETEYFFSRTALMYIYMGHMRFVDTQPYEPWFWTKNRINLLRKYVNRVDVEKQELHFSDNSILNYDKLVIACGSAPNKFGWPGQDLNRVSGMVSYQDLENMEAHSEGLEHAVVVGGGLIGIEMAEMFHSRNIHVSLLVREDAYWSNALPLEEAQMVSRHIKASGIDLQLATELKEIVDDGQGNACAVITSKGDRIECGYVGLTAGVHPNVGFLKDTGLDIQRGIVVNDYLETNLPNIYAIGDCAQLTNPKSGRRPIEAIWYTGRMMGETVAYNILGKKVAYDPGIWFNSAKFIDIEYQVYGEVPAKGREGLASLYWEHSSGEKAIRINYEESTGQIRGFNLMGIRYRHEVCEKWIKEETHVEKVLQNLGMANFDPEFYDEYEEEVIKLYNQQTGKNLQLKQRRGLSAALRFLGL